MGRPASPCSRKGSSEKGSWSVAKIEYMVGGSKNIHRRIQGTSLGRELQRNPAKDGARVRARRVGVSPKRIDNADELIHGERDNYSIGTGLPANRSRQRTTVADDNIGTLDELFGKLGLQWRVRRRVALCPRRWDAARLRSGAATE
jgi:hypothetical protein